MGRQSKKIVPEKTILEVVSKGEQDFMDTYGAFISESMKGRFCVKELIAIIALAETGIASEAIGRLREYGFDISAQSISQWKLKPEFSQAIMEVRGIIAPALANELLAVMMEDGLMRIGDLVGEQTKLGMALVKNRELLCKNMRLVKDVGGGFPDKRSEMRKADVSDLLAVMRGETKELPEAADAEFEEVDERSED